jgi:hypothetical protein
VKDISATDMRLWSAASAASHIIHAPKGAAAFIDPLEANDSPEREMIVEALLLARLRGGDPHKVVADALKDFSSRMAWEYDDAASPSDKEKNGWAAETICKYLRIEPIQLLAMRGRLDTTPARTCGPSQA